MGVHAVAEWGADDTDVQLWSACVGKPQAEIPSPGKAAAYLGSFKVCGGCGGAGRMGCGRCRNQWYCGRSCQARHWKQHKKGCSQAAPKQA
mmetsp:Transcript_16440/g.33453  ORF Transcript_16440/g.33453 Transcript_16440/m.33453 type:complete len:91 (-) Transcript_16440:637-909(-)